MGVATNKGQPHAWLNLMGNVIIFYYQSVQVTLLGAYLPLYCLWKALFEHSAIKQGTMLQTFKRLASYSVPTICADFIYLP